MHLFLSDDTSQPYATLLPDESRHCVRVLRMGIGSELWVTSGNGVMCHAIVTSPDERACEVEIKERIDHYDARPFHLHIAVAPTKNSARLEWLVEKAVEIGIDRITPVICDHSERAVQRTDRLSRIALSAMKQSLKAQQPQIDVPIPLSEFLHQPVEGSKYVCYCTGNERHTLHESYIPGTDATVLIGPEGDFSAQEINLALQQGYTPITLGKSRLRTETAALYAITVLNFMND